jgi:hypothetical protein
VALFTTGQVVTAAQLNALNGYVAKTADQSVTSSTTLVNDTHLFYSITSAGTYVIDIFMHGVSAANAAGDLAVGFSYPTGTLYPSLMGLDTNLASGLNGTSIWVGGTVASGAVFQGIGLSTSITTSHAHCLLVATATGTFRLQWAQAVANANASTLKAGSHMLVRQVA